MGHSVTLGGERVGSGNKNKIYLHNYERSTHNLSQKFTSTIGVGMLIPFMCIPATRDDKFEIDISAGLRTIPTKGPLFGSFKLQIDVYQCPWRLYQALLHNNPLAIGLKANQVKFPKMRLYANTSEHGDEFEEGDHIPFKAANNSLVKYLGVSAIGNAEWNPSQSAETYIKYRDLHGSHLLAYYDIFKNYYANKQEDNAYTIGHEEKRVQEQLSYVDYVTSSSTAPNATITRDIETNKVKIVIGTPGTTGNLVITGHVENKTKQKDFTRTNMTVKYADGTIANGTLRELLGRSVINYAQYYENKNYEIKLQKYKGTGTTASAVTEITIYLTPNFEDEVVLKSFPLKNIDQMRMDILSYHTLGASFIIGDSGTFYPPYTHAIGHDNEFKNNEWQKSLAGICVKTYQSDLFNNWINTEWIDGTNGIAEITAISTSGGSITIDALNFSEKLYNLLNRIAVSGATYEDYLDAAYTDSAKKFCEAPMWVGGMSDEIVFEEIVQTAPAEGSELGTLGGRGNLLGKKKGGKITIKIDEPSWIIGIVSITPRIQYTQGNEWYNTEIDSLQDIHVPALDGIAFQNLMAEQMLGECQEIGAGTLSDRPIVGKVPAWINYMTAVDKAYGDFAAEDGDGYMILNRNYDYDESSGELVDATTYIDPAKYNYAFAYTKRDAQNFWLQINSNIKTRRLMSAKQIPNV